MSTFARHLTHSAQQGPDYNPRCNMVKLRNLLTGDIDGCAFAFNLKEGWYDRWVTYEDKETGRTRVARRLVAGPAASMEARILGRFSCADEAQAFGFGNGHRYELKHERVHAPYQIEDRVPGKGVVAATW